MRRAAWSCHRAEVNSVSNPILFLLSPANLNGKRGKMLFNPEARFELAKALRTDEGAPLGEVYSFVSGLYFRGKAGYAAKFADSAVPPGAWVITPGGGLCTLAERVTIRRLQGWQQVQISEQNPHFTAPLLRHVCALADVAGADARFVLLGSVASKKYVLPLLESLGPRLLYPTQFAGLGDMARGALLLRCAREGRELQYTPLSATRPDR
jgi:hypothetical protein